MKRLLIVTIVLTIIIVVSAEEANSSISDVATNIDENDSTKSDATTDIEEGRIRHHHILPFYGGLLGLGGLGGLHALAVLFAIKVKIVVVAALVGLGIYYYSKFFKKGCGESIFPFSGYSQGPSGYSSNAFLDHNPSGYSGPDPYSAYSDIHPDISSLDLHHHATGFEDHHHSSFDHHSGFGDHHHDSSDSFEDHPPTSFNGQSGRDSTAMGVAPTDSGLQMGPPSDPSVASSPVGPSPVGGPMANRYRRVSIQKRQINEINPYNPLATIFDNVNWGEIAFQFLGVDSDGCRRRFVCELDFRVHKNPFTRMAFAFIGRDFFDKYRDLSENGVKPTKYADCAKMYRECAPAKPYDNNDNDDNDKEKEDEDVHQHEDNEETTTNMSDLEEAVTDVGQNENEITGRRMQHQPLGRLIFARSEK